MTPESWRRVGEIFHQAVEVSTADRGRWVASACNQDEELLREVNSLLRNDQDARAFVQDRLKAGVETFVDDERARAQTRRETFNDGTHVCIGGNADHHHIDHGGEIGQGLRRLAAELRGERERIIAAAIPDGFEQSVTMEIFCHGSTHGTETRKANALHRRELSGASATKENAVQRTAFIEHLDGT